MTFTALLVDKADDGAVSQTITMLEDSRLPEGDVTVAVDYSTLNYKDGLCLAAKGGLVRTFPHVPGVDFSGTVEQSDDPRYSRGDKVILTGWRVGEVRWGGYATRARVKADWLVPLPDGLTTRQAMAIGTAGLTAMLAVIALQNNGLQRGKGEVLVTGASGGVGSVAVAVLARLGYAVAAVTGRPETADYLRELGAATIIDRAEISQPSPKPLESERWAGVIDAVGGEMLGRALKQMKHGAAAAAIGLAGGAAIPSFTVTPFLLRGIKLIGIDSVQCPFEQRVQAWDRLVSGLPLDKLDAMIVDKGLADLPALGRDILRGAIQGRVVINVSK
ncbi:MDR family oxidoreductase [Pararhizobium sp.]|uniref:MDR family oxidoreductase n=1 Tax=Pararhizobium sp. TaxID=1977563 RepID=UPI002724015A|nr:MDR family oxidoreductase [Pararhizobium sp.]MDO9418407.1 MDR family oxidoreductase [Pararhizobium sp.]